MCWLFKRKKKERELSDAERDECTLAEDDFAALLEEEEEDDEDQDN